MRARSVKPRHLGMLAATAVLSLLAHPAELTHRLLTFAA